MAPPPQVVKWLNENYPRPRIDPVWIEGCCSWITSELALDPARPADLPRILGNVDAQLLQSDLSDSALPDTGLPPDIARLNNARLRGPPVLVEITAITDVGHSAFALQNVRQTRVDRADLAGLNEARGDDGEAEEEEEGPVPRYPRSMLSLQLSDGSMTIKAVEYRKIPQLVLGETPLGYKLLLKDVLIRRGIAFLEPSTVVLKGHQTEDRDTLQDADFVNSLRARMGLPELAPEPDADAGPAPGPPPNAPLPPLPPLAAPVNAVARPLAAAPAPAARPVVSGAARALPPPVNPRPPFRDLTPSDPEADFFASDDEGDERVRPRKVPRPAPVVGGARPPATSPFWPPHPASAGTSASAAALAAERFLSPVRGRGGTPLFLPSPNPHSRTLPTTARATRPGSDDDDDMENHENAPPPRQPRASADNGSSEYDFADDSLVLDESALAEIERTERAALGLGADPSSGAPSGSSSLGTRARTAESSASGAGAGDVISIDSDDDDDEASGDKENVPAPVSVRRVRRKVSVERVRPRGRSPTARAVSPTPAPTPGAKGKGRARARPQPTQSQRTQRVKDENMDVIDISD